MNNEKNKCARLVVLAIGALGLIVSALVFVPPLRTTVLEWWYIRLLDSEDESKRRTAAERLGELQSERAVPALIELYRRTTAEPTAEMIGRPSYLVGAVCQIQTGAIPDLVKALGDTDPGIRAFAGVVAGCMRRPFAESLVPALTANLDDPHPMVRMSCVFGLGGIGPAANEVLPEIDALLEDPNEYVRYRANEARRRIDGRSPY